MKCSLGIFNFLEEISSLSYSTVYFFALITEEGFLISPCYSLELCIQMGKKVFAFLLCLLLLFFSQLFIRPPQTTILPFCISCPWGWSWSLPPVQCHEPLSIVLQALSVLILESISHFHCIIRDLIYVIPEWSSGFPYFLQLKSEFGNKEFMIWATVSSQSCFRWLDRTSPSLAAKNIINLILVLAIWWCPCIESSLVLLNLLCCVCYDQCILLAKLY